MSVPDLASDHARANAVDRLRPARRRHCKRGAIILTTGQPVAITMKFTLDAGGNANYIAAYRAGAVRIGEREYQHSLIVTPKRLLHWSVGSSSGLTLADLADALQPEPDILVLGTGPRLEFPPLALQAALSGQRVGLEIMNTAAACRTYNVLLSENRRVAAALIVSPAD